ncbi:hypothetical protein ECP02999171_1824 [Escherichia coli P0299917.1]|nr:hypothetical protein ECP02999171_1824 [Escherichia coli P0299917.1]ENB40734.1 hypothetical protein ECMP0215613_1246 [Escherichia coli MP021561.3]ENC36166.1 hypothetical protein ECP029970676_1235 [Escherichia coli P02997067.6]
MSLLLDGLHIILDMLDECEEKLTKRSRDKNFNFINITA